MYHADNPLLYEFFASNHRLDQARAARVRPLAERLPRGGAFGQETTLPTRHGMNVRAAIGAIRGRMTPRATTASCCSAAGGA